MYSCWAIYILAWKVWGLSCWKLSSSRPSAWPSPPGSSQVWSGVHAQIIDERQSTNESVLSSSIKKPCCFVTFLHKTRNKKLPDYYLVAQTELTGGDQSVVQAPWQLALVLGAAQASVLSSGQKLQPRLWRFFFATLERFLIDKFRSCPTLSGQGWASFGVLLTGNFFLMSSKDIPTIAFWNFWASWTNIQNVKMYGTTGYHGNFWSEFFKIKTSHWTENGSFSQPPALKFWKVWRFDSLDSHVAMLVTQSGPQTTGSS